MEIHAALSVSHPIQVHIPPAAFLQPTEEGQRVITELVLEATGKSRSVVDLFAGCGTYAFPMSRFAKVHAVEFGGAMTEAMQEAVKRHQLQGRVTIEQRDLEKHPLTAKELQRFDAAVINPPRKGAIAQSRELAKSGVPLVVMVSCNPDTFSRDAKVFAQRGYRLEKAVGIDQFHWTTHVEIVAVFRK